MPVKRYPHSVRFSQDEWDSITLTAEANKMAPGEYVRKAAVRAAAETRGFSDVQLTPQLIALIEKTFRGVHLLAYLKREELAADGNQSRFERAVAAARTALSRALSRSH